jgi:mRNA-degrading endonuclease RelE of RelBE toxin-antitoxin system
MEIIRIEDFEQSLRKLPNKIQRLFVIQEDRFRNNWRDPRLHIKKVKTLPYALSFRITRRYRVFFYFKDAETAVFFDIDHRKDIYR